MDKTINRINLKSIIKFIILWVIITALFFILYSFFTSTKKVQYRGVLVEISLKENIIL